MIKTINMEQLNSFKSFINGSNTFAGFAFQGMYNMSEDHFFKIYEHYLSCNENILDKYTKLTHLIWDKNETEFIIDDELYSEYQFLITDRDLVGFFDAKELDDCSKSIEVWYQNHLHLAGRDVKRSKACSYTNNEKVRKEVFKLHGNACLCCGSTHKLALDHVIPVSKGGENSIDNMQPLCTVCNSKKGSNIIDYRKGVKI